MGNVIRLQKLAAKFSATTRDLQETFEGFDAVRLQASDARIYALCRARYEKEDAMNM